MVEHGVYRIQFARLSFINPRVFVMAGFFDLKARKEAAAINGSSSKAAPTKENTRLQPWVEK